MATEEKQSKAELKREDKLAKHIETLHEEVAALRVQITLMNDSFKLFKLNFNTHMANKRV